MLQLKGETNSPKEERETENLSNSKETMERVQADNPSQI